MFYVAHFSRALVFSYIALMKKKIHTRDHKKKNTERLRERMEQKDNTRTKYSK